MREIIERFADYTFILVFGALSLYVFTTIALQGIAIIYVNIYEDNLVILYSELILSGLIFFYGIYRFIRFYKGMLKEKHDNTW